MAPIKRSLLTALTLVALVGLPGSATAQPSPNPSVQNVAIAQALFDEAMKLFAEAKYAEACPKLAESDRLDPGMVTRYRLAECYEKLGLLASAWAKFVEVADAAKAAGQTARHTLARERADALEHRLPKLTIAVPSALQSLPGLEINDGATRMEKATWGLPLPVDPGEHTITAVAPGRRAWKQVIELKDAATETVVIGEPPPGPRAEQPPALPQDSTPEAPSSISPRRIGAIAVGTAGLAGLVVGGVFGARAFSKWDEALGYCDEHDVTRCDLDQANPLKEEARQAADVSTATFVVGGAALAGAALLWFLPVTSPAAGSPRTSRWFVPTIGPNHAGLSMGGTF